MKKQDVFSTLHPAVSFSYFGMVICFAILLMHPLCLLLSLAGALLYALRLKGGRAMRKNLRLLLPLLVLTALVNPAFSHQGVTVLAYLPSGNPLTRESVLYGIAAATMLGAVFGWFACFHEVMTSDKFVYLFGRMLPALSLLLSMTLRFVPRFLAQAKAIAQAQKGLEPEKRPGLRRRMQAGMEILSALVTWSMEGAVDTADSMRSRGYGLPGRTAFSLYRLDRRDIAVLAGSLLCAAVTLAGRISGALRWNWYPAVQGSRFSVWQGIALLAYAVLCLLPWLLDAQTDSAWSRKGGICRV